MIEYKEPAIPDKAEQNRSKKDTGTEEIFRKGMIGCASGDDQNCPEGNQ